LIRMTFEIFAYWNIMELQLVFNAVAAIVGSADFLGLLRTLALVGVISMSMAVLAGFAQLPDFGRWLLMFAILNGMLLVPKVNVVITDKTGTQPPVTVANVPIGLAAFGHSISHIGDWLTNTFETTFSLPADIQFRTNGTLFGHRVQQELLHARFDNPILTNNLLEFYRECVIPEFTTGYVNMNDITRSNDIWGYLNGRTNPGRLVTIRADDALNNPETTNTYGCDVAYTHLTAQVTASTNQQIANLGRQLYPGLPTAQASTAVQGAITTSTSYMLGISTSAFDGVKQTAISNFMIDAQYMLPAQIGDAASAATNLGQAQAIRSTSESYKLMAKLAESTMPKVKNIVEIIQYAVFPIIMLIVLLAGHKGLFVLKAYVMSLVWIQLWPPLYAVMHLIMTMHAQDLAQMTGGLGLSMSQYSQLNNAYISDEAIAGMIAATAIPAIATLIVKGGDTGAQAIAGMVTPAREAEKIASGMALGNMQMGNASLGNHSFDNASGLQHNTRPTITQGTAKSTMATTAATMTQEAGTTTMEAAGSRLIANTATGAIVSAAVAGFGMAGSSATGSLGRSASDMNYSGTGTASQTGTNASLGDATTARLTKEQSAAFQRAYEKALSDKISAGTEGSTGKTTEREQQTRTGSSGSTGLNNSEGASVNTGAAVRAGGNVQPKQAKQDGEPAETAVASAATSEARDEQPGRIRKIADAMGAAGGWILSKVPVSASAGMEIKTGQQYSEEAKKTLETATKDELKQAAGVIQKAMTEVAGTTKDAGVKQAAERISSALDKARTYDSKEIASLLNTAEAGNRKQEGNENRIGANIDQSRLMWDEATRQYFGKPVENMHDLTPKQFREFAEEWNKNPGFRDDVAMQVRENLRNGNGLHAGVGTPKTPDGLKKEGEGKLHALDQKGKNQVATADNRNDGAVKQQQFAAPRSTPELTPAAEAYAEGMSKADQQVQREESKVLLGSGVALAATALYQDRQRGMGQVMSNSLLGGAGSASVQDYAKALDAAAQKDPELARGLARIALDQQHGKEPSNDEIQWVNDRANGAVQDAEGSVSGTLHNFFSGANKLGMNVGNAIKDAVVNGVGDAPGVHADATPAVPAAGRAPEDQGQPAHRDAAQQPELTQRIALSGQQLESGEDDGVVGQFDQVINGAKDSNQMTPLPARPAQTGAGQSDSKSGNNSENAPLRK